MKSEIKPTRKQCGCTIGRDLGMYDTCPYGCVYCYANQSRKAALEWFQAHSSDRGMLVE
jgi:DNA repair photolyase